MAGIFFNKPRSAAEVLGVGVMLHELRNHGREPQPVLTMRRACALGWLSTVVLMGGLLVPWGARDGAGAVDLSARWAVPWASYLLLGLVASGGVFLARALSEHPGTIFDEVPDKTVDAKRLSSLIFWSLAVLGAVTLTLFKTWSWFSFGWDLLALFLFLLLAYLAEIGIVRPFEAHRQRLLRTTEGQLKLVTRIIVRRGLVCALLSIPLDLTLIGALVYWSIVWGYTLEPFVQARRELRARLAMERGEMPVGGPAEPVPPDSEYLPGLGWVPRWHGPHYIPPHRA
jgi:hypothetical protein